MRHKEQRVGVFVDVQNKYCFRVVHPQNRIGLALFRVSVLRKGSFTAKTILETMISGLRNKNIHRSVTKASAVF